MRVSRAWIFIFCIISPLASDIAQAEDAKPTAQRGSSSVKLLCSVMLTVPLVNLDPAQPKREMTPSLPSAPGGGPSFQKYYVNMDITTNKAAIFVSAPDEPGSTPLIQFSGQLTTPLADQKARADFYLLDRGKMVNPELKSSSSLVLWVDRTTGWFELVTIFPGMPYPSQSWEVGICSDRKYKF